MFREWPAPKTKDELLTFTYMLLFLRNYIPGRVDLTAVLRTAILEDVVKTKINGKSKTTRTEGVASGDPKEKNRREIKA